MKKRILSAVLAAAMSASMIPALSLTAFAAGETVGISDIDNSVYKNLGINTDSEELKKQANDDLTPYGRGRASLLTRNELSYIDHAGDGTAYDVSLSGKNAFKNNKQKTYKFSDADIFRSVAFDPFGSGMQNYIAAVSAKELPNGDTVITLGIDSNEKKSEKR